MRKGLPLRCGAGWGIRGSEDKTICLRTRLPGLLGAHAEHLTKPTKTM